MGAGAAGASLGLLSGKGLKASLTEGLKSAAIAGLATGATRGFGAQAGETSAGQAPTRQAPTDQGPLTTEQVNQQISEMAKGQPGNVSGSYNPATGRFEVPVSDAVARTPAQIAEGVLPRGNETLNNQAAASLQAPAGAPPVNPSNPVYDFGDVRAEAAPPPVQKGFTDTLSEFYDKRLSPGGRAEIGAQNAEVVAQGAYEKAIAAGKPEAVALRSYDNALKAATPGVISNYGPIVGTGLGITALAGGFKPKTVSPSGTVDMSGKATQDIINANPSRYITQGLPGVSYDASGNITGSTAGWNPRSGVGTTEVSGGYMPYAPSQYQPYNFMPRYAAQGGYMQSSPAFPGTPLTAQPDQRPMMGGGMLPMNTPGMPMNTPGMPMNTSGAPMNLPMGYAMGGMPTAGIASLGTGGYPRRTGQISGPGTETSDSIPAMLSEGEFVMTAKAVKALGKGNRRAGAKKMYALMHHLEKNAARG
jgi:hypothetical protein